MWLANEPKIALHIQIIEGAISSSRLTLSDSFICTGANDSVLEWIHLYLSRRPGQFPLPLTTLTRFQGKALEALQKIPFGQTRSYGEIANDCGFPRAARAIGNACNKNPFQLLIPCHRVIQGNGKIGGFAVDLEIKRKLLDFEAG